MTTLIHPGERLDELHPYGLFILQHPDAVSFWHGRRAAGTFCQG